MKKPSCASGGVGFSISKAEKVSERLRESEKRTEPRFCLGIRIMVHAIRRILAANESPPIAADIPLTRHFVNISTAESHFAS
jgi:hypothetical protein